MPNEKTESTNPAGPSNRRSEANGKDRPGNGSSLTKEAKAAAGEVYNAVSETASSTIEEQKAGLTGRLSGVADTVRRVSGSLHETEQDNSLAGYAAQYTDTAAEKIESVIRYFDSADVKDLARDLEAYARRNPAVFLGSAFAIGIMAARFLKSSPPSDTQMAQAELSSTGRSTSGRREGSSAAGASHIV